MEKQKINPYRKCFEGTVKKVSKPIVTIEFNRIAHNPKYERFSKARTSIRAKVPKELLDKIKVNDKVILIECRPLSKTVHHVIVKIK